MRDQYLLLSLFHFSPRPHLLSGPTYDYRSATPTRELIPDSCRHLKYERDFIQPCTGYTSQLRGLIIAV